ncbi:hypothetical protein AB835_09215 [Candidatus Endobugula sertula]|uniref:Amino acid permease n=1 Tax=Candidatus Endobugula sertula TaxID=62101 RepID=A0A1D2QPC2_9GAMM|nr:hypothetical protein AB835_09215 [Candidatus Endobugula sertula]
MLKKHLSVFDGYILYTTSVIGLGLIVLPSIAARLSGTYSIFIWIFLSTVSYSMGRVMSYLSSEYPSSGGVTSFIAQGLGKTAGHLTSILYLSAIFFGVPATALFFSEYLSRSIGSIDFNFVFFAFLFLLFIVIINMFEAKLIMKFQKIVFFIFLFIIIVGVIPSFFKISIDNFTFDLHYSLPEVMTVPLICFFAFVGWENAIFSSEEFKDPRTLNKSLLSSALTVGLLFTLVSIVTVGTLGRETLEKSNTSLSDIFFISFGRNAEQVTSFLAVIIIFVMTISWVRGSSRLVYFLAKEKLLPKSFSVINQRTSSPNLALCALMIFWSISLFIYWMLDLRVENYLRMASINFLVTYIFIFTSAFILMNNKRKVYSFHLYISIFSISVIFISSYADYWYPMLIIVAFFLFKKSRATLSS